MTIRLGVVVGAIVGLTVSPGRAGAQPNFGAPTNHSYALTSRFRYTERLYVPPVKITQSPANGPPESSPEGLLWRHVGSMMTGAFDVWLDTWDAASRAIINREILAGTRTEHDLLNEWDGLYLGSDVWLTKWITFRSWIILVYEVRQDGRDPLFQEVVLRASDGKWGVTRDLVGHPLLHAIQTGVAEVSRVVR